MNEQADKTVDSASTLRTEFLDINFLCETLRSEMPKYANYKFLEDLILDRIVKQLYLKPVPIEDAVGIFREHQVAQGNISISNFQQKVL